MLTTILTSTWRNAAALLEAAKSVQAQTSPHWRWWIVLDSPTDDTRQIAQSLQNSDRRITAFNELFDHTKRMTGEYRPAVHFNNYGMRVTTDYFCWLSDDDILEPNYIAELSKLLIQNPSYHVAYGESETVDYRCMPHKFLALLAADTPYGPDCDVQPSCRVDGGQILQTAKSLHDVLKVAPMPTTCDNAGVCDGVYLNELASRYKFIQFRHKVMTNRRTHASTFPRW